MVVPKIPLVAKPPQMDYTSQAKDETVKFETNVMKDILQKGDDDQAPESNNNQGSIDSFHGRNKDLNDDLNPIKDDGPQLNIKKKIVRTVQDDAFFKTGVDVQEHEEIDFEGTAQDAAEMFKQG